MEITWLGHAAFCVRIGNTTLVTDPFADSLGLRMPSDLSQTAVVTVSNGHPHHSATQKVNSQATLLTGPGEYETAGFYVRGIRTPLLYGSSEGGDPAWNTVFTMRAEGLVVCHLGDLGSPLSPSQLEEVSSPDVLLVPAGGRCTISPSEAAELVATLAPRVVIPMHYAHPTVKAELEPLDTFLHELGMKAPVRMPKLSIAKSGLPAETEVVCLDPVAAS